MHQAKAAFRAGSCVFVLAVLSAVVAFADPTADAIRARIERLRSPEIAATDVSFVRARVVIRGNSGNPNAIAKFVENVKNDSMFEDVTVHSVTQTGTSPRVYEFEFSCVVRNAASRTSYCGRPDIGSPSSR